MNIPTNNLYLNVGVLTERKKLNLDNILKLVCKRSKLRIEDVTSKCRNAELVRARSMYCLIARNNLEDTSLGKIGEKVKLEHSTVSVNTNKLTEEIGIYKNTEREYKELEAIISNYKR